MSSTAVKSFSLEKVKDKKIFYHSYMKIKATYTFEGQKEIRIFSNNINMFRNFSVFFFIEDLTSSYQNRCTMGIIVVEIEKNILFFNVKALSIYVYVYTNESVSLHIIFNK